MKKIITFCALLVTATTFAQTINWKSLKPEQKHIANLNFGLDYSTSFGLGYGYQLKMKVANYEMPVVLHAQLSIPAGENKLDDFKSKLGGQVLVYKANNIAATVIVNANFRGYQNELAKIQSFGSEFTAVAGYYKSKWFGALEFGFDKAIATHIAHTDLMKEYYPGAKNGWYVPTAGNFNVGMQAGYTIKTFDVTLKAGKIVDQSFTNSVMLPFYLQLGINKRF